MLDAANLQKSFCYGVRQLRQGTKNRHIQQDQLRLLTPATPRLFTWSSLRFVNVGMREENGCVAIPKVDEADMRIC